MGPITEHHLMLFLFQFALLLGACKVVGFGLEKIKQPTILGDILVGLFLGPAIFGQYAPELQASFFPKDAVQLSMLGTIAWFGNLFLLMETGLEINFSRIWHQRGKAIQLSFSDLIIPVIISFPVIYFLPDQYMVDPSQRVVFSLFIATIMTISALPVAIHAMRDLNILKSDTGFLIVSALTINDIIGWVVFTIILGVFAHGSIEIVFVLKLVTYTVLFTVFSLTILRKLVDRAMTFIHDKIGNETGYKTTFTMIFGMLMGALTLKIGIHALFGFFIAGIVIGEAKHISEKDRNLMHRMVYSIFVPIFFAKIGLQLNILEHLDWLLIAVMTSVGLISRFTAAYIGAKWAGQDKASLLTIAICHSPGGEMHIVVAMLAFSSNLISESIFISIITASLISTIIFGPWLSFAVRKMQKDLAKFIFSRDSVLLDSQSSERNDVLHNLSAYVARKAHLSEETVYNEILNREKQVSTAVGLGIAFPHARMENLDHCMIVFLKTTRGIEWDSPDGKPVNLVFLILTPESKPSAQLKILQTLSLMLKDKKILEGLRSKDDIGKLWSIIRGQLAGSIVELQKSI